MFGPTQAEFDDLKRAVNALKYSATNLKCEISPRIDNVATRIRDIEDALAAKKQSDRWCLPSVSIPTWNPWNGRYGAYWTDGIPSRTKTELERRVESLESSVPMSAEKAIAAERMGRLEREQVKLAASVSGLQKALAQTYRGRLFTVERPENPGTGKIFEVLPGENGVSVSSEGVGVIGYLVDLSRYGESHSVEGHPLLVAELALNWTLVPKEDEKRVREWRRTAVTRNEDAVEAHEKKPKKK